MTELDEALRRLVAAEHGLEPSAGKFLNGATIAEVGASAARLADVLAKQREPEQPQRPATIFERAAVAKAERKQALLAALSGQTPQQPRDTQGRYAAAKGLRRRRT